MRRARALINAAALFGAGALVWFFSQPPGETRSAQTALVRLLYTPSPQALATDGELIAEAHKSIDFAGYVLTDRSMMEHLIAAARRGVKLRLYLDRSFTARGNAKTEEIFKEMAQTPGVELRFKAREAGMMHLKSFSVDGRYLRTGSANFSFSGGRYQDNDILILDSPSHVAQFEQQFEMMWRRADNEGFSP